MPGIDDLPADQRAVLQLVLRQGRSYAAIAGALGIAEDAVRGRAHGALDALGPATPAPADRRARAADWLLGQQEGAEAERTARALSADEDARAWAAAVRGRLAAVAARELPAIPDPAGADPAGADPAGADPAGADPAGAEPAGAEPASAEPAGADPAEPAPAAGRPGGAAGRPRASRRGGAILLAALALAAVVALVLVLTRGDGGDGDGGAQRAASTTSAGGGAQKSATRVIAQVNLKPPRGATRPGALGVVQLALVDGKQSLTAIVQGLAITKGSSWGIWAEGGPDGRRWLGPFSQGDRQGRIYAQGRLEPDMDILKYRRLVVTRDAAKTPPETQGKVFLAGAIAPPRQQGG